MTPQDQAAIQQLLSTARRNFFDYSTPALAALAQNATGGNTIQFDTDSIFVWTKTSYHVDIAGAVYTVSTIPVPLVNIQIQDTATTRTLFFQPQPIETMAGGLGLPFVLPAPQVVMPSASFKFTYTNFSGGGGTTYANLQLVLHGWKFYGAVNASGQIVATT
jgi:hypothetical protein